MYDESLSYLQQLAIINKKLKNVITSLDNYVLKSEFEKILALLESELEQVRTESRDYTDEEINKLKSELTSLVDEINAGMFVWNVTRGKFTNNIQTMRDFFNDVTVHSLTVDALTELENFTVDDLAECGLNVRGVAVWSGEHLVDDFLPVGVYYTDPPEDDRKLTTQDLRTSAINNKGQFVVKRAWLPDSEATVDDLRNANVDDGIITKEDK